MSRDGYSPIYREPSGGVGTVRGAQLTLNDSMLMPAFAQTVVEFTAIGGGDTHPGPFDDFALRSVAPIVYGAVTIPTGSAVVIDAAHAGRWKIGATAELGTDTIVSAGGPSVALQFFVNINESDWLDDAYADDPLAATGTDLALGQDLTLLPMFRDLVEDDVVWMTVGGITSDSSDLFAEDVVLVMEWCGA